MTQSYTRIHILQAYTHVHITQETRYITRHSCFLSLLSFVSSLFSLPCSLLFLVFCRDTVSEGTFALTTARQPGDKRLWHLCLFSFVLGTVSSLFSLLSSLFSLLSALFPLLSSLFSLVSSLFPLPSCLLCFISTLSVKTRLLSREQDSRKTRAKTRHKKHRYGLATISSLLKIIGLS